jgi:hypothetical protein
MPPNNRSREEVRPRKPSIAFGIVQIGQGTIRGRLIDPPANTVKYFLTDGRFGDGRGFEFPIGFCVEVAAVERESVLLHYIVVKSGLIFVDSMRDEVCFRGVCRFLLFEWYLVAAARRVRVDFLFFLLLL